MEHGFFTPLFFSLTCGEDPEASKFHKHIAQKINKTEEKYKKVQALIGCKCIFPKHEKGISLFGVSYFQSQMPFFDFKPA